MQYPLPPKAPRFTKSADIGKKSKLHICLSIIFILLLHIISIRNIILTI